MRALALLLSTFKFKVVKVINVDLYLKPYAKDNSKCITGLNTKAETKTDKEEQRGKFHNTGFGNDFL